MGCRRSCCYGPRAAIVAAVVGTLLCITFALLFHYFGNIFQSVVVLILPLSPGSPAYAPWVDVPLDPYINIYLFNYTNTDKFSEWGKGVKPEVQQLGPYTYTVHMTKVFMDWSEPPFVRYRQLHYYKFHPELSSGTEDDRFITPNPIALIANVFTTDPTVAKLFDTVIDLYPEAEPLFMNVTAGELISYGYYDEAFDKVQQKMGFDLLPGGMIGLLYGRNGSDDRGYRMNTGTDDPDEMYHIVEWDGHTSMDYEFGDHYCGMINGSDGTMFPPGLTPSDKIFVFVSLLRRSIFANYTNPVTYKGIDAYNYQIPLEFYGDYNLFPDNACYTDRDPDKAYASGSLYMGKIVYGAPLYISNPHFMGGDMRLVEDFVGLKPMGNEHAAQFTVIPEFGAPIQANIRLQLNMLMKPGKMNHTADWPTLMLPLLWGNGSLEITDDMAADIRKYYYGGMKFFYGLLIAFIIICGLVGLAGILCSYKLMFQFQSQLLHHKHEEESFNFEQHEPQKDEKHD